MGKVFRLTCQLNLLLSCLLSALYTCQHLTLPAGPASFHRRTQSMSLYGHAACTVVESWFNFQQRRVDPLPFTYLGCCLSMGDALTRIVKGVPSSAIFISILAAPSPTLSILAAFLPSSV